MENGLGGGTLNQSARFSWAFGASLVRLLGFLAERHLEDFGELMKHNEASSNCLNINFKWKHLVVYVHIA